MFSSSSAGLAVSLVLSLFILYVYVNNKRLGTIPNEALAFSPKRSTPELVLSLASRLDKSPPISIKEQIPPKTGRRYIIVGGSGFVGGWIVSSLLERGEDPKSIRILDLRPPIREDVTLGIANGIQFLQLDVCDPSAVHAAFSAPWPSTAAGYPTPELTVFDTVANIRFYERHPVFLPRSANVNVNGTENIIDAARSVGASVLIYTSSGSVAVRRSHFFLWPWQKEPKHFVQVLNEDENTIPKRHEDFFSNYAVTKMHADRLVRSADKMPSGNGILRTGCVRPGNGIFGPRGDIICGSSLERGTNPSWMANVIQSFCYVENCVLAHLCYEQRLIELLAGSENPDIGGQAFLVADPGPPPTYGDFYTAFETLTAGRCTFPDVPVTVMLMVAYGIELYYLAHYFLINNAAGRLCGVLARRLLPAITGDLACLQPSLFALTSVHIIVDDSRARLSPQKGGLGYKGAWTTLEGLHKTVQQLEDGVGRSGRQSEIASVGLDFGISTVVKAIAKVAEKVVDGLDMYVVRIWSAEYKVEL